MKIDQLISTTFLLVLFLTSCNKDKDKEYGTLVFKGVSEIPDLKSEEFCDDELSQSPNSTNTMHTTDLFVNIAEIWASQGEVAEGLADNFTWHKIGEGNDLKSVSQYLFTYDLLPVGEYKSLKILFRNHIIRKTVYKSDYNRSVDMEGSLDESGCASEDIRAQYFSKNGNHSLQGNTFHCDSRGENIRGFKIKPNETTTVYWQLGSPGFQFTDCNFKWYDENDNQIYDCGTDHVDGFSCSKEGPMWTFGVDDGEIDPFLPNAATDADGNSYDAVLIGDQVWLTSNLKTTRVNDGTLLLSQQQYQQNCDSGFCPPPSEKLPPPQFAYPNNQSELVEFYGLLYNWKAVNTSRLCPSGWHIPTREEWEKLITFLGTNAGGKLKVVQFEPSSYNWQSPNTGATNEYEFAALPAGGNFGSASGLNELNVGYGINALFFSSTNESDNPLMPNVPIYILTSTSGDITMNRATYDCFLSCRCIQD